MQLLPVCVLVGLKVNVAFGITYLILAGSMHVPYKHAKVLLIHP